MSQAETVERFLARQPSRDMPENRAALLIEDALRLEKLSLREDDACWRTAKLKRLRAAEILKQARKANGAAR